MITPPINPDVFPGITRLVVLRLARVAGIEIIEKDLWPTDLQNITGAFLCSTLMEIRPLARIDRKPLSTEAQPAYRAIVEAFRALTAQ